MYYSPSAISDAISNTMLEVDPTHYQELTESGKLGDFIDRKLLEFEQLVDAHRDKNPGQDPLEAEEIVLKEVLLPRLAPVPT